MPICLKNLLIAPILTVALSSPLASADTLQQIFDLALSNDPDIRAAEADLNADLQLRAISRSSLLPQISLSGSYTDSTTNTDMAAESTSERTTYSADLNQKLFDLPAWYTYKRGDALANQAEQVYLSAKQDLILRTATSYFDVLRALDTMSATKSEEISLASQLEQTQQRYEVGLIAITDVHEAQAAYDDVVARLVDALGSVGIAFENLTVLTGQMHNSVAPLKDDFPILPPNPASAEEWVELALANSFDLKSATLSRDASKYNAQSKKWEHAPSLSLGLSYSDVSSEEDDLSIPARDTTSVSLSLDIPLYLGGSLSASRRQAYYQLISSEEGLNSTRRSLIQSTRNQHLTVRIDVSEVNAREKAIISSESAYEATKAGYDVGTRNLVDVLGAEQSLYQARRDYSTALYDYIIDLFTLDQLAGELTSTNISEIDSWLSPSFSTPRSIVDNSLPGMPLPSRVDTSSSTASAVATVAANTSAIGSTGNIESPENWTPEQMLARWASDWSTLSISDYLGHYSTGFDSAELSSRNERLSRLSNTGADVNVSLSNINVVELDDNSATVLFDQNYSSGNYSDRTEKEIQLIKQQGRWKISSEKALSVYSY